MDILSAIETGEERICRALLDDQPRSGRKWNDGLREAAARGMLDVTFQLVQLGADVNSATVTGRTALAIAPLARPLCSARSAPSAPAVPTDSGCSR